MADEVALTLFKNLYDVKTDKRMSFDSFSLLEGFLYKLSKIKYDKKKDAPLMSPAIYETGTRKNVNVISWAGWAGVDIDDFACNDANAQLSIINGFPNVNYVCYSTASSTVDKPKFRLVIELSRSVTAAEIRHFWYALNKELGDVSDGQCKDYSRMYFVPGTYKNSNNFIFSNYAKPMSVDFILKKHEYETKTPKSFFDNLPKAVQADIISQRKEKSSNSSFYWSSYRECPFWPKNLALEYLMISDTGWYSKMYAIMVSIAARAIKRQYPISAQEISDMCLEFDANHGNWYKNRPILTEANRAIEYAYSS